jgi:hypothetical protein
MLHRPKIRQLTKGEKYMQTDMHYYGTYAMARAAGIERDACFIIATAAQFVDDHANKETIKFRDGARIDTEATAHHSTNINNVKEDDQRMVWVPFHFLPGNEGEAYQEKMLCRKDSDIAKEMVRHALTLHDKVYALPLIGITAHVYADTFSHHGFSGYKSSLNKVDKGSFQFDEEHSNSIINYIRGKVDKFYEKFQANIAESLSKLGHGAVATFPDRPYLKWSFTYESQPDQRVERNNPKDFLDGCKALHLMFSEFVQSEPDYKADKGKSFEEIESIVQTILACEDDMQGRINAWKGAANSGRLFANGAEEIPDYDGSVWHSQRESLANENDSEVAISEPIYHFYQAASIHRTYILRDLLPDNNLVAH